jgi:acyl carrier protein phosphodiesterase
MNWLAHLYLSEPDPAFRLGNLLPDLIPAQSLASLPAVFQKGIMQHRRIDAFTDSHPVVRQSIQRIEPAFRRFGGILCDIFYDHFLARDWDVYSAEPLPDFARVIYASFDQFRDSIPTDACLVLDKMRAGDWLCSYRDLAGVSGALERVGSRLRRRVPLAQTISMLKHSYDAFHSDFCAFFPELQSHAVDTRRENVTDHP